MNKETEKELHHWDKLRRNGKDNNPTWQGIWDAADQYGRDFEPDVEAGLRKLKLKLDAEDAATAKVVPLSATRWLRTIAAVGVLLLLAWAGISILGGDANTAAAWVEVQTSEDEKREIVLPDGSAIILNENSYLAYSSDLNEADIREVNLEGEAYFEVEHRPDQAFEIITNRAAVKVLGTSFNVRAFAEETNMEVEVASGRVAVRSLAKNEEVILEAQEAVVLDANNTLLEKQAPFLNRQAWRTGQITLRKTHITEVLPIVARFYGIDFDVDIDKLTSCSVTANWKDTPLDEVLETIELHTSLQIKEIGQDTYQVSGQCDKVY